METLFAVAAVAVIILAVVTLVALWFAIGILRNVRDISRTVKYEVELIKEDIGKLREAALHQGFRFKGMLDTVFGLFQRKGRKTKVENAKK